MIFLTRHEHFNAAHRLYNPSWTEDKNRAVFGKCANPNWHGHNYELIVTVKGEIDPDTGFLIDAKKLGELMNEHVCDKLDHKNLNLDVDFMRNTLPSTENLAIVIWQRLSPVLPVTVKLHSVRLHETPKISVEYFGPEKTGL
jgi:6-pyruvoyltetrahydropterin/6-carboxytetrahydropterin synthase